ncbi:MAG: UDP-glucuronic acid decarboxylase family protein [Phenylobacterium sp.]|uniref:UDP-glucuronic acid decarboxylase family protein n=1 Tax=Phenylobacterium sp. TaxID=1871053 RepID=UPI00391D4B8A
MQYEVGRHSRVLVAGGAGFVGSHLCEALARKGAEVVCLDNFQTGDRANLRALERNERFSLIERDVVRPLPAELKRRRFTHICNLACAASPKLYQADPEHTMLTSVLGADRLLRLAERHNARFLMASTSEVYGDPDVHPQSETYWGNVNCTGPRACYDEGKRAAESLCFDFDRMGRASVRVARIFNTYGPRLAAADGRVVSNLITQALGGEDMTVFGAGDQTRSFCFVSDLVEGLIALLEHGGPQPGPVNLGNPTEVTVGRLAEMVRELCGSSSAIVHLPLPTDDPRRRRPDISKAQRLLEWSPRVGLVEGLYATIDWFEHPREPVGEDRSRDAAVVAP